MHIREFIVYEATDVINIGFDSEQLAMNNDIDNRIQLYYNEEHGEKPIKIKSIDIYSERAATNTTAILCVGTKRGTNPNDVDFVSIR